MESKNKTIIFQIIGTLGTLSLSLLFIRNPSFPTPDKIIIFLTFFFMIFKQAIFMLKRLLPFVLILLVYESFRGIADQLNSSVNYDLPVAIDRLIFGDLPTSSLQAWLWEGQVRWFDIALYVPYLFHFVLPLGLAILIWKTRESYYWNYIAAFCVVSFAAFFTFLIFPAAPPWMAAQNGHIEPIVRISSDVWYTLGIKDFPSLYDKISPNPVAAVPSLHAAWALLVFIFVNKIYGWRFGLLSALYPTLIFFGTVYQAEHYVFDVILGVVYAIGAYLLAPKTVKLSRQFIKRLRKYYRQINQTHKLV